MGVKVSRRSLCPWDFSRFGLSCTGNMAAPLQVVCLASECDMVSSSYFPLLQYLTAPSYFRTLISPLMNSCTMSRKLSTVSKFLVAKTLVSDKEWSSCLSACIYLLSFRFGTFIASLFNHSVYVRTVSY